MTPTYALFRRWFGRRWAAVMIALLYAGILLAVVLTFGTSPGNHIPYLDQ